MKAKKEKRKVAVFDFETDPFLHGREPLPFAAGFYDGADYFNFWGDDCVQKLCNFLETYETPLYLFAHNGGKFDFYYLLKIGVIANPIKIINGRIIEAEIFGKHKIRDSYAIVPIPLNKYQKTEIDYRKFEKNEREKNKTEILSYLKDDCIFLFDLVDAFVNRFGPNLTIGGTAIKELQKIHPFERTQQAHDERFRPYYFGGRVECFRTGIINGNFKIYDVNSMYPHVMRDYLHPIGENYLTYKKNILDEKGNLDGDENAPYFIHFEGKNRGAIPVREKTGLNFNVAEGEYYTTSHEIKIALKHGLINIDKIIEIKAPLKTIKFPEFVDKFINEKIEAKRKGDKIGEIFAKLIANSAYGKFAQNPDNFYDYVLVDYTAGPPLGEWELYSDFDGFEIWRKPIDNKQYFDVSTACSITSAARSVLLDALHTCKTPIYCDTDSIICEDMQGIFLDDYALGAWKFEGEADTVAIAGKKLYAAFNAGDCVKLASKGVRLSPDEIFSAAKGEHVVWQNMAPSFKLDGTPTQFITRELNKPLVKK